MDYENYHNELLKKVANMYNMNYEELLLKVPYKIFEKISFNDFLKEYMIKSLKELQELAIKYNVSKSGKKEKIIERIYPFLSMREVSPLTINIMPDDEKKEIERKDIGIGTESIEDKIEIEVTKSPDGINDKDLLLLLRTHNLSIDGSRNDLIERLKNFYRETNTKEIIKEHIMENIREDEYVSRIEINEKFMNLISTGISIDIENGKWIKKNNIIGETEYVLIPIKNWIFRETEMSYEFIGIANMDHTYNLCDIPNELMEITK